MAHWDEERDGRWVKMMRDCQVPNADDIIGKFEETGDLIYWSAFIEHIRTEERKKHTRGAAAGRTRHEHETDG